MDSTLSAASGQHTTGGVPHGFTSLTPFIAVADAPGAIEFYQRVFDAKLISATPFGDGIAHAELQFATGRLQLASANAELGLAASSVADGLVSFSLTYYCADVDDVVASAVEAGATLLDAPTNFASGDRYASFDDPHGVRWSIMTRIRDVSDAEAAEAVQNWTEKYEAGASE